MHGLHALDGAVRANVNDDSPPGTHRPVGARPRSTGATPSGSDPGFASDYAAYQHASGNKVDPLHGYVQQIDPAQTGLAAFLTTNAFTSNPRAKQQFETVKQNGSLFHIYYTPDGKRQVFRVSGDPLHT